MKPFRLAVFSLVTLLALAAAGCQDQPGPPSPDQPSQPVMRIVAASPVVSTATGLVFDLAEGIDQPDPRPALPVAPAQPLSDADTRRLLARLPALEAAADDAQPFALPPQTLPAPRAGAVVQEPFPPPAPAGPAPETESGPLQVLRYAPEGEVALSPNLNLTFNQPMVALTGIADLAAQDAPVTLSPQPAGQWRWVGTKTLLFEPAAPTGYAAGRFPMATRYTVTVPAGTQSAVGGVLDEALTFSFSTPSPQAITTYPTEGPTVLDPLLFIAFDQRIDPAAVLETISARAGSAPLSLRLASDEEIATDRRVQRLASQAQPGYWLALRAATPLPPDTQVVVRIGPGVPSLEGPLASVEAQTFAFQTYGPLKITEQRCGWGGECTPFMPWHIHFSNALDASSVTSETVRITPALPGAQVDVYGNSLKIQGQSAGRTTYTVQLGAQLGDRYGQTLGREESVRLKVGSARPFLARIGSDMIVLDPYARPALSVYTVNLHRLAVEAYAVSPDDWAAYQSLRDNLYRSDLSPMPPGELVLSTTVPIEARTDTLTETVVDLRPALPSGTGHLIVKVEAHRGAGITTARVRRERTAYVWIQATQIGLDALVDGQQMVAWANSLVDGAPLANVELRLLPGERSGVTGADGVATLPLPAGVGARLLAAQQGDDVAFLPASYYGEDWRERPLQDSLAWYVFDDRGLYRPDEEVHVKGWIRRIGAGLRGDVGLLDGAAESVSYELRDSRGNRILQGSADLNALGGFDFSFQLPSNINLGNAVLQLDASGGAPWVDNRRFHHSIPVQEFRRPEFEVQTAAGPGPFFVGAGADLEVTAAYYAGGGLPNADVTWAVSSRPGAYSPPGWDDFTFGRWTPWWRYAVWDESDVWVEEGQGFSGLTDAAGVHRLRIEFRSVTPPEPSVVTAEATVQDVNRQAWTGSASLLVHPADLYVGLRSARLFVQRGQPLPVDAIVTDLDGAPVTGVDVEIKSERLVWRQSGDQWREEAASSESCRVTSALEPVGCTFATADGGTYRITADVADAQGRPNRTEITRWVSGGQRPPARQVEQEEVLLIPDRQHYQPGDVAEILVQAPFYPAEGLLTLQRSGLLHSERFRMEEPSTVLRVPIEAGHIPNLAVQVDLVGAAERGDDPGSAAASLPRRPAYATGQIDLLVPPLQRTLSVVATPAESKLEPGGSTTVEVEVRDALGQPAAGAELAVVVVDEAILALTGYDVADPVAVFYAQRPAGVEGHHSRARVLLASPSAAELAAGAAQESGMMAEAPAAAAPAEAVVEVVKEVAVADMAADPAAPIALRSDFNPLAHWSPAATTDAQGRATLQVKLPDNLTRYRVTVVAVAGGAQFGKDASAITARLALMVRPSPPRFLNFGDQFELPVVVQNQTDEPLTVDVAVAASNVQLLAGNGRRVVAPANDRVEVRFPAATASAGTARFQVAAAAVDQPGAADAASFSLPVYTPATTEAFAVYGVLDAGAVAQPVIAPTAVFTQFGGLEITTSSTALQALTDAVLYLVQYPFECSEQIASRILAITALRDVLSAFQAAGLPPANELEASVERDIQRLRGLQNADGGFPIWSRGYESWPYHSVHTANALQRAKLKGYSVPPEMLSAAREYLRTIERRFPDWYGQEARWAITAYALNVRNLMGDADPARARRLIDEAGLERLSPEAIGWLLPVLSDDPDSAEQVAAIRRHLLNRVTETAGAAHFASSYGDQGYVLLHSNRRADGILLDALIGDQPDSDLIPKLVAGLLAQRKAGRWSNTQENSFILLALDRYFNTYEAQTPDFVARVWLGEQYAGEASFRGRSTDYRQIDVPMSYLASQPGTQDLVLDKEGPGRLYYRLGLRYAPSDLNLPPYDAGFTVMRRYEAVDDPADVWQDEAGVWHMRAGARVRVTLTMVAPAPRYHVALSDPLPAGLEAINPALAVSGSLPAAEAGPGSRRFWWWGPWYEHQNLRDQRAEAFASWLWDGVHAYSYVARATTPGVFVVPPAKAEEMYAPETFGRSAVDRVVIE